MNAQTYTRGVSLVIVLLLLVLSCLSSFDSFSQPITKNEIEDKKLIPQSPIADPNVAIIFPFSAYEEIYGGAQIGNWTSGSRVLQNYPNSAYCGHLYARKNKKHPSNIEKCLMEGLYNSNKITTQNDMGELFTTVDHTKSLNVKKIYKKICGSSGGSNLNFDPWGKGCDTTNNPCIRSDSPGGTPFNGCSCQMPFPDNNDFANFNPGYTGSYYDVNCNNINKRVKAVMVAQDAADLSQCPSNKYCNNLSWLGINDSRCTDPNFQTGSPQKYDFTQCTATKQLITYRKNENCTGGTPNCQGAPAYGSSAVSNALNILFNFLDADNSIEQDNCDDTTDKLWDGNSNTITCKQFLETPYRDVSSYTKTDTTLPTVGTTIASTLIGHLTQQDADELGIRLLPMSYLGKDTKQTFFNICKSRMDDLGIPKTDVNNISDCTSLLQFNYTNNWGKDHKHYREIEQYGNLYERLCGEGIQIAKDASNQIQFQGDQAGLHKTWKFYRNKDSTNSNYKHWISPVANVLGFDNEYTGSGSLTYISSTTPDSSLTGRTGNYVENDALKAFNEGMANDDELPCRPQFVIFITSAADTCAHDPNVLLLQDYTQSDQRYYNDKYRSMLQAVSNLRTKFSSGFEYKPGKNTKKEVLTFVIKLGETDESDRHLFNTMALTGGTNQSGVIRHRDPETDKLVGSVDIDNLLPDFPEVYRELAKGGNRLDCGNQPTKDGDCTFDTTDIFDDAYFDNKIHTDGTTLVSMASKDFAFFIENASELGPVFNKIFDIVTEYSTTGSPASPSQAVGNPDLRDRIFVSLTLPTNQQLWQGRLALYSFVQDPENPSTKLVLKKPEENTDYTKSDDLTNHSIFSSHNVLDKDKAQEFHWEAGRKLAERDIKNDERNIFTVDSSVVDSTISHVAIYEGATKIIDPSLIGTSLNPSDFGIDNNDVQEFDNGNLVIDSTVFSSSNPNCDCTPGETTCTKKCLTDKIADFISGNTGIDSEEDGLGPLCLTPGECPVRLGSIFHSMPKTVGYPSLLFFDTGFQNFAKAFKKRSAVVYVGANDGGLHAFHAGELQDPTDPTDDDKNPFTGETATSEFYNTGNGSEMFFYIPPTFLTAPPLPSGQTLSEDSFATFKDFVLKKSSVQKSFFDGTPTIMDVFIDGFDNGIEDNNNCTSTTDADGEIDVCGKEWHTVLISGFKNGGGGITALDITNAYCGEDNDPCDKDDSKFLENSYLNYPTHLWTLFDSDFGNSWSRPVPAKVKLEVDSETPDRWVVFVGGGLDPITNDSDTFGNAFYAIDIPTGQVIYKFHPDRSIPNDLGVDQETLSGKMQCEMASDPAVFDINTDGYADLVYIGDTCGILWRFDVSAPIKTNDTIDDTGITIDGSGQINRGDAKIRAENWTASIAFCANSEQECNKSNLKNMTGHKPIFYPPTAVMDNANNRHIIFQTGNRRHPTEHTKDTGRLYNFVDEYIPSNIISQGLADSSIIPSISTKTEGYFTTDNTIVMSQYGSSEFFETNKTSDNGEFIIKYPNSVKGEKGISTPVVVNGILVFLTYNPVDRHSECVAGLIGESRLYAVNYLTGENSLQKILNTEGEEVAGMMIAQGITAPPTLTTGSFSSLVLSVSSTGNPQSEGANFAMLGFELPPNNVKTTFWQEIL